MFSRLIVVYSAIFLVVLLVYGYRVIQAVRRRTAHVSSELGLFGPRAKCPLCGSKIPWSRWPTCPRCSNTVQPRRSYGDVPSAVEIQRRLGCCHSTGRR